MGGEITLAIIGAVATVATHIITKIFERKKAKETIEKNETTLRRVVKGVQKTLESERVPIQYKNEVENNLRSQMDGEDKDKVLEIKGKPKKHTVKKQAVGSSAGEGGS
jgi:hypothetical protein